MADKMKSKIRLGVFGLQRGAVFTENLDVFGVELVAVCDRNEERVRVFAKQHGAAGYTDFDAFIEHDMDAVVVANYFHQHAPFAIRALRAGKHVMSETSACRTIKEGVELVREVERSGKIYMFAENYAYFSASQEMRKQYRQGAIGEIRYAEGEYVHPMSTEQALLLAPGFSHWRNVMPSMYYNTHALAPLMYITDTMPIRVNGLSIADPEQEKKSIRKGDPGFVILCRMNNGAVFRLYGTRLPGERISYKLTGSRGYMENIGGMHEGKVRIAREEWNLLPGEEKEVILTAQFDSHAELAKKAGHGGGDFWTMYHFTEAIRTGRQPYLDVYRGVAMSAVGILGWKSALQDGAPVEVPDFRNEAVRKQHENDDWSPFPEDRRSGQPWPSIRGDLIPSEQAIEYAKEVWSKAGYKF